MEPQQQHLDYIGKLTDQQVDLLRRRWDDEVGTWDSLEGKLPPEMRSDIRQLRDYEQKHDVNLTTYLLLYARDGPIQDKQIQ